MEIGLLICDHARKELNHPDGSYPEMFRRLLPDFDFSDYYVCDGNFPGSPYECDGWCIGVHEFSVDFEHKLILANAPYLETEQIASGILSLQKAVHSLEVGEWMGRFLVK